MTKQNQKIIRDFCNCLQKAAAKYCAGWRVVDYLQYQENFIERLREAKDWSEFADEVMHPCRSLGIDRKLAIRGFYRAFWGPETQVSYGELKIAIIRVYRSCLRRQRIEKGRILFPKQNI